MVQSHVNYMWSLLGNKFLDVELTCCDGVKIKTNKCFYESFDNDLRCVFKGDVVPEVIILPEFTSEEVHLNLLNNFSNLDSTSTSSQYLVSSQEEEHEEDRWNASISTLEDPKEESVKNKTCLSKVCHHCGAQFENSKKLSRHYYNVHPKVIDAYQCDVCLKRFPYKHVLTKHVQRKHKNSLFPCLSCNKEFTLKFNLLRHLRKFHTVSDW